MFNLISNFWKKVLRVVVEIILNLLKDKTK